jgi:hypothetical protein
MNFWTSTNALCSKQNTFHKLDICTLKTETNQVSGTPCSLQNTRLPTKPRKPKVIRAMYHCHNLLKMAWNLLTQKRVYCQTLILSKPFPQGRHQELLTSTSTAYTSKCYQQYFKHHTFAHT